MNGSVRSRPADRTATPTSTAITIICNIRPLSPIAPIQLSGKISTRNCNGGTSAIPSAWTLRSVTAAR